MSEQFSVHYNHPSGEALGTIFSTRRGARCNRDLSVILQYCNVCGHRKAFMYDNYIKCTRCGERNKL